MKKKTITWTAVIDGRSAHFYSKGPEHRLGDLNHTLTARPLGYGPYTTKRELGHVNDRFGKGRHIIERRNNGKTQNKKLFTQEIAGYLERSLKNNEYNRLVIIAPPEILGLLRKSLCQSVEDVIALELDKDFTHLTPQQIQEYLTQIIYI